MEFCMEARALKSRLRRELSFIKSTQQVFLEDILCGTGISAVSTEDFSVDDLLDFSNGDFEDGSAEEEDENEKDSVSVSSSRDRVDDDNNSNSASFSSDQTLLVNELVEPVDDFAELEWVSQFVDDSSCSEFSLLYPNYAKTLSEPAEKPVLVNTSWYPVPVPSKAKNKRTRRTRCTRRTGRVWSPPSPLSTESTISSPSSSSSSSGLSSTPCLIFTNTVANMELFDSFNEPAAKKAKKKPTVQGGGLFQRRCSHCQTQKTPQWRTGPLGPKTLCNACGVRYKSGRLFPEYRPACSPTFSVDMHSNSHRKVLEMRKKKEMTEPEVGMTRMVQSF